MEFEKFLDTPIKLISNKILLLVFFLLLFHICRISYELISVQTVVSRLYLTNQIVKDLSILIFANKSNWVINICDAIKQNEPELANMNLKI